MVDLLLAISLINDTISYITTPSNRGEIIFQLFLIIIGIIITWLFAIFCKPIHKFILNAGAWWEMYKTNPDLDMEISISGGIPLITPHDFVLKMSECLGNVSNSRINPKPDDSFEFSNNFNSFSGTIIISPGFDSRPNDYNYIYIRVRTTDIKLKKVKDSLGEIQIYLFRDLVGAITRKFKFDVNKNNEGISVRLRENPAALRLPGGVNVDTIIAHDEGIRVTFGADNISINGDIEPKTIKKIENIIRSNLNT